MNALTVVPDEALDFDQAAERLVLGALMHDPRRLTDLADVLSERSFGMPAHQRLWSEMVAAHKAGHGLDPASLLSWLTQHGAVERCGGALMLSALHAEVPTVEIALANVPALLEEQTRRQLTVIAARLAQAARTHGSDLDLAISSARRALEEPTGAGGDTFTTPREMWGPLLERMTTPETADERFLPTGYYDVDRLLQGGLRAGQLIVVGGRPSHGKSLVVLDIARHVAFDGQGVAALFSQEMTRDEVYARAAAAECTISLTRLDAGEADDREVERFTLALEMWEKAQLHVEDTARMTVTRIGASCRRLKARAGRLDYVGVDYLHLLQPEDTRILRREQLERMTRELKVLAGELGCPIVLASQLNRANAKEDRPPRLDDLRETGAIEQDANTVMLLHRETVEGTLMDEVKVIVAKQRNGPLGETTLRLQGQFGRLTSMWRPS